MSSARGALVATLVSFAVLGCSSVARREARALVAAVDRYRHAADASKLDQARAVAASSCSDAEVCDAKQTCVGAIDPTARGLALKDEVARRLVDIQEKRLGPDDPEARALPDKLDHAAKLLNEGRAKMIDCDRKLGALELQYGS